MWRITGLFWNLEFDATTERLLVVDKETGAFKDGWHWQRADPNETPEVSPAPPPSAVPATGAITTAPAVPQTHGMAVLRSVGKASLWVNGLRLGETAGEEAGLTAPVSLSAGDVIVIASTAERSSGVVLGWRGPGNMAVVTRADRWVLLRGAETDISSLTTDMLDQVKTRPTVARGLSKAEAEIREVLGGTTVQALTGPTNGSQFLVAIRLKPEDFITIPKTSP
ncbi:MAG TPA: hypothetical protein DCS97_08830 [Planctomycetes bacterium]|nr:hypothetical protein [Planctomycetota bacterium]